MKKVIKYLAIFSLLGFANLINSNPETNIKEDTFDESNLTGEMQVKRNAVIGDSAELSVSKTYVQYGTTLYEERNVDCLRFVTAVKGNFSKLTYAREHIEGINDVEAKEVTTVYKGVMADNKVWYYDGTDITTDEAYAGQYYWAAYTIRFINDTYKDTNITVNLSIDGEKKAEATSSLNGLIHEQTHTFEKLNYNEEEHWYECAECQKVDYTTKEKHTFSLEVTKSPKVLYMKGDTFNPSGMEVSKVCECGYSHTLLDSDYSLDKTTLDVSDTFVTISSGDLSTKLNIEVGYGEVTNIAYEGDPIKVVLGGTFGEITQKVKVTYQSGDVIERGIDCDDIEFIKPEGNSILGMKYVIRVQSKTNNAIYTEIPAIIERVLQGEDATIVGGTAKSETEYVIQDGAYVNVGSSHFAGDFGKSAMANKDAYVEFNMTAYTDSNVDLTLRCANSNLRKDESGYYMAPLQINTIADLYVNGELVTIGDDVVLAGIETRNSTFAPCYNVYSTFTFKNVAVQPGNNVIKLQFKNSTTGEVNHWKESPSTMNIDWISMTSSGTEVTGELAGIEIQHADVFANEVVVLGQYGNRKAVLTEDKYRVSRTFSSDNTLVTYKVTLIADESKTASLTVNNVTKRIEAETGTIFGVSGDGKKKPGVNSNKTEYVIQDGTLVAAENTNTYVGGFDASSSAKNGETGFTEPGIILDANYTGHFNLAIRMTNQSIKTVDGFRSFDVALSSVMKVEIIANGTTTQLDLTGKVLLGSGDLKDNTTEDVRNNLFNVFQTVQLGEVDLVEGSQIKITYYHETNNDLGTNCWTENPAGNIDYLELSLADKKAEKQSYLKLEAEDATLTGGKTVVATETQYKLDGKYQEDGQIKVVKGLDNSTTNGGGSMSFAFNAEAGDYTLLARLDNMYYFSNNGNYCKVFDLSEVLKVKINGQYVTMKTVMMPGHQSSKTDNHIYATYFVVELADITLLDGENTIVIEGNTESALRNGWTEIPVPRFDYIELVR